MADKFKRYGIPVRLENTPLFNKLFESFVKKIAGETGKTYAHVNSDGEESQLLVSGFAEDQYSIVRRNAYGCTRVGTPLRDDDAATKKYVDDAIAALKAELTK